MREPPEYEHHSVRRQPAVLRGCPSLSLSAGPANNRGLKGEGGDVPSDLVRRFALLVALFAFLGLASPALAWSNGGYSADPADPDRGTHDWIADHALAWLPAADKAWITANRIPYLYGTELPDNAGPPDGIGDQSLHHVYVRASGALQDDAAAVRASEEYAKALAFLQAGDERSAARAAGVVSHYLSDVAVFGHVMGASTDWGAEVHHSDYEDYVRDRTTGTASSTFDPYLAFDGSLAFVTAYDATLDVAYDTTFGVGATRDAVWMDTNYDWADAAFRNSAGASLNRAVNAVADVLHTLAVEADYVHTEKGMPTVAITSPTTDATWITSNPSMTLSGTANDNVGVTSVTWRNAATGASGDATGTASWMAAVGLGPGRNAIVVTARDAAGNSATDTLEVTLDSAPPTVSITSPIPDATLPSGTVTIGGTASDNVAVQRVQVSTDGTVWRDCTGTTAWACSLAAGPDVTRIYARATDTAGNSKTAWIPVNVTATGGPPSSGQSPGAIDVLPAAIIGVAAIGFVLIGIGLRIRYRRRKRSEPPRAT